MTNKKISKKKLKRSESFLGVHFDFHAGDQDKNIGKHVTPDMIESIIKQVKPDYVQCDCKGHRGFSSYPTKVGYAAPGIKKDALKVWREVTAKYGVALYMHYSGVWDTEAIKHHPSWARIDENGKRDKNNTSVYGPYVNKLLIPQFKELCDEYGVDGVWVDGECWATSQDYHPKVLKAFREKTGIEAVPKKPTDPYFFEFMEFCRNGFRNYLDHYVTAMHDHNPDLQVASNWAYSSFMPEKPTIDVDFISGDYPMLDSVNAARLEGQCLAPQEKPWDLMAWGFVGRWEDKPYSVKTPSQLKQEAAIVLALGGGFQTYFMQKRDGSVRTWQMKLMAEVAKFCRARQKICHKAKAVPQIALLNSSAAFYRKNPRLFSPWEGILLPIRGILRSLLDSQNSVEILMEHHLTGRMSDYPLIILPELDYLEPEFKKELLEYVNNGGNLLLIGPAAAKIFRKELGAKFIGKAEQGMRWLEQNNSLAGFKSNFQRVKLDATAKPFGKVHLEEDFTNNPEIAGSIRKFGKGKIAASYMDMGQEYNTRQNLRIREWLESFVRKLFSNPIVKLDGSHHVDVCVNRIDDKLAVNLINTSGPHGDNNVYVFDHIPVVGPLKIKIRTDKRPQKVTLEPLGQKLDYTYDKGAVILTLGHLEIHDIIVIE